MDQVYIAINGDDVGESIGSAIASDDQESLGNTTSALKQVHRQIDDWVESIGGEVIVSSGDEGIYAVPGDTLQHLEDLRNQYSEFTGHTLTIGIGSSMSEASKALIYGKMSNKNQIVEYSPEIEDSISGGFDEEPAGTPGYEQQHERDLPAEQEMQYMRETGQEEDGSEDEIVDDQNPEEIIDAATEDASSKHSKEPAHEMDMSPEEEAEHDRMEQEADEVDADIIEADEEIIDQGTDGEADDEEEMMEDEDESDHDEMIAEMVYSQMQGEDEEEMMEEEPMPEEEMMEEEPMPEEETMEEEEGMQQLKGDITSSLQAFKQYKELIEETQGTHPDFYNAMIVMLRSMVEMAKILNFNPEEELGMGSEAPQEPVPEETMQQELPEEEMYQKSEKTGKK